MGGLWMSLENYRDLMIWAKSSLAALRAKPRGERAELAAEESRLMHEIEWLHEQIVIMERYR